MQCRHFPAASKIVSKIKPTYERHVPPWRVNRLNPPLCNHPSWICGFTAGCVRHPRLQSRLGMASMHNPRVALPMCIAPENGWSPQRKHMSLLSVWWLSALQKGTPTCAGASPAAHANPRAAAIAPCGRYRAHSTASISSACGLRMRIPGAGSAHGPAAA